MMRTRLYRFVKFIGRWSMVDIYVAAILAAFVQFGILATVKVGPRSGHHGSGRWSDALGVGAE